MIAKDLKKSIFSSHRIFLCIMTLSLIALFHSCASIGTPSGGDYDFDPPKVVKATPGFNSLNVDSKKIEIIFDELVQIDKPQEKIIVTPPQRILPKIYAVNKKVYVELRDTLIANTTYTVDFTDAIIDNNEKNALENFSLSFSTGDQIDTLAISGKVLAADNLEPVKGIHVGLHSNLNDSAFTKLKFDRISRTNDRGEFTIRGIRAGKYRIFALDDKNRDYTYDNPSEAIAFLDSLIVPSFVEAERIDTVFNADKTVDSLRNVRFTRFTPDDIILRSFVSGFQRQYLQKYERPADDILQLTFGSPTEKSKVTPLNFSTQKEWAITERSLKNDSIKMWITDPSVVSLDTISVKLDYFITDSVNNVVAATDTLNFVNRNRRKKEDDKKKKKEEEVLQLLQVSTTLRGEIDVYSIPLIEFEQPVIDFDESKFRLSKLVDSSYVSLPVHFVQDSLNPRKYSLLNKWEYGASYKIEADSAVFHSIHNLWNGGLFETFKVKREDQYGRLLINLTGVQDSVPMFVQLLDKSDQPVRKSSVRNGRVLFSNLAPDKYYARLIIDTNNNGVWDTGDYDKDIQPEMVYYYNSFFDIRAYWDETGFWNVLELPIDEQKPLDITKNKPQEKASRQKQLEEQEDKQRKKEKKEKEDRDRMNNNGRRTNSNY